MSHWFLGYWLLVTCPWRLGAVTYGRSIFHFVLLNVTEIKLVYLKMIQDILSWYVSTLEYGTLANKKTKINNNNNNNK